MSGSIELLAQKLCAVHRTIARGSDGVVQINWFERHNPERRVENRPSHGLFELLMEDEK
jgi:hypothetical protein